MCKFRQFLLAVCSLFIHGGENVHANSMIYLEVIKKRKILLSKVILSLFGDY